MKKILAFSGSNSSTSINQQLVEYTASLIQFAEVDVINLANYEAPLFGVDLEKELQHPAQIASLAALFQKYDGFILSTPEHNSMPPAFLISQMEWLSRIDRHFFNHKPMFLMSTSPGARGALAAQEIVENVFPRFGTEIVETFSLSNFKEHFVQGEITTFEERRNLKEKLENFHQVLSNFNTPNT
jgi:chromate reductase